MSEYDPVFDRPVPVDDDLERARELFEAAGSPYLSSPWPWLAWALVLPAAALGTPAAARLGGLPGVLLLWSVVILIGGAVELLAPRRLGPRSVSTLARWAFRAQGNLSLAAVAVSVALVARAPLLGEILPGLWLLLLGHSLFTLGGLTFRPLRTCGLVYQAGGLIALWPGLDALVIFAVATAAGNLWMAVSIWRRRTTAE